MRNVGIFLTAIIILAVSSTHITYASDSISATASSASATSITHAVINQPVDIRAKVLEDFLSEKHSPLAPYASVFIEEADANDIDWRLLPAISGVESSFGVAIPVNSYNGWGFGIYGTNVRRFSSWEDGIATISAALHTDYILKGHATTVDQIGRMYAASPTWSVRVENYMQEIDLYTTHSALASLPISL